MPELPDVHMMQAQVMATSASWNEAPPDVFFLGDEMDTSSDGGDDATATDMTTTSFACTYPVEMEGVVAGSLAETTSFMSTAPLASITFSYANSYLPDWTPAAEEAYSFENVQSMPLEQSGRCGRTDREPAAGRPVPGWEINHQDVVRERRRGGADEGESEDERPKRQRDKFPRFEPEEFEGTMDVSVARHRLRVLDDFDALVSTFDYTDGSDQSDHEADDVSTGSPPYSPTLGPVAGSSCPDSSEPARVHEPRSAAAIAAPQPLPHPVPILADRLCSMAIQSRNGHERNDDQASRDVVRSRRDRASRRNRGLRRLGRPATATRVQRVSRTGGRNSMVRGQGMLSAVAQYLQRKQQNEDTAAHDSDGSDDGEMGDDEDEQGDVAADVGYRQQTLSQRQYDPSWMVRDNADESEQEYDPGAGDLDY
ncbi:hypothetical protein K4F52_007432 [Lecanicillium sp. MT-2017a]|nr:hypothetical protein K4F52_007432 [Lecanicillium sp. MT-2017a]